MHPSLQIGALAGALLLLVGCIPFGGIGGDSFDADLVVTLLSLEGDPYWEAEPVPLIVDVSGAPKGASVVVSGGGVPWASFHWPDQDRVDLILGQTSSTWMFAMTVMEDDEAKYPDTTELQFGVMWSNPEPADIESCVGEVCGVGSDAPALTGPTRLSPQGPIDDMVEARWWVDNQELGAGDPSDGSLIWAWNDAEPASHDVRVHVVRSGGLDSFGYAHLVTSPAGP
jgi:hypothetical protein